MAPIAGGIFMFPTPIAEKLYGGSGYQLACVTARKESMDSDQAYCKAENMTAGKRPRMRNGW